MRPRNFGGAVARVVVADDPFCLPIAFCETLRSIPDARQCWRQKLLLVKGWNNDGNLHCAHTLADWVGYRTSRKQPSVHTGRYGAAQIRQGVKIGVITPMVVCSRVRFTLRPL